MDATITRIGEIATPDRAPAPRQSDSARIAGVIEITRFDSYGVQPTAFIPGTVACRCEVAA